MHSKLINQAQPFGQVENHICHPGMGGQAPISHKSLGAQTEVPNHGHDKVHSFADKAPGAKARANAHRDNPFYWTGKPV